MFKKSKAITRKTEKANTHIISTKIKITLLCYNKNEKKMKI